MNILGFKNGKLYIKPKYAVLSKDGELETIPLEEDIFRGFVGNQFNDDVKLVDSGDIEINASMRERLESVQNIFNGLDEERKRTYLSVSDILSDFIKYGYADIKEGNLPELEPLLEKYNKKAKSAMINELRTRLASYRRLYSDKGCNTNYGVVATDPSQYNSLSSLRGLTSTTYDVPGVIRLVDGSTVILREEPLCYVLNRINTHFNSVNLAEHITLSQLELMANSYLLKLINSKTELGEMFDKNYNDNMKG